MGFPRQEDWSGLPFPSPGDLYDAGIKPESPALAGDFLFFFFLIYLFWGVLDLCCCVGFF